MKDYKRLTKWSELGTLHVFDINGKEIPLCDVSPIDTDNLAGRLAELEDKIESGEIVYRNTYLDYLMSSKNISELTDKEIEFFVKHNARVRENTDAEIARLTAWKRRAEVAERALSSICADVMSDISVMVFPSTKTQVQNKQELYDYCIKQAEKELVEVEE